MLADRHGPVIRPIADIVLGLVALTMLAFYVSDRRPASRPAQPGPKVAPENWRDEISTGIRWGPPNAELTIVEFMDFECPFCAQWAARVDSLVQEYPGKVQIVVQHFPLTIHAHATAAAVAAECADRQGKFHEFQRNLFTQRAYIGTKPWTEFAAEAAIPDLKRFERCVHLPSDSFPRIAHGIELGKRVGIRGTPTVWVNDLVRKPTLEELRNMIEQ
jgi:protein-disulfide isomerase